MKYEMIEVTQEGGVKTIKLDRPKSLNALCTPMMKELAHALATAQEDSSIGCVVLTGSEKAFAAGADIKEMQDLQYINIYKTDSFSDYHDAPSRFIGKAKAMDMCLTGRMMDAEEAERSGLVSRVVPLDDLMPTVMEAAAKIAAQSQPIAMMTKETLNAAFEMPLSQGLLFERRLFQSMFTTEDQKEGMNAFVEKRKPHFKNK